MNEVVQALSEQNKYQLLIDDMRTTINLLAQTNPKNVHQKSLVAFMKEFKLTKFKDDIKNDIKINNILHFYEVLEGQCAANLVKNMNNYSVRIEAVILSLLENTIKVFLDKSEELEEEFLHIKRIIERLCIRLLSQDP